MHTQMFYCAEAILYVEGMKISIIEGFRVHETISVPMCVVEYLI